MVFKDDRGFVGTVTDTDSTITGSDESGDLSTTAEKVRLPHDQSGLLWFEDQPTALFLASIDRWAQALLQDDGFNPIGPSNLTVRARVVAKQAGTLCGVHVVNRLLDIHLPHINRAWQTREGGHFQQDDVILILDGTPRDILAVERIILNFLGRLSGIATNTEQWVKVLGGMKVASTRKTTWGILDKWAVHVGGGFTHRLRKGDAAMIKENDHIALREGDEERAKETMKRWIMSTDFSYHGSFTVIEVDSISLALTVAKTWCNRMMETEEDRSLVIMLDNMGPTKTKEAVMDLRSHGYNEWIYTEASGNIRFEDLEDWKGTGADILSTSGLNMGVSSIDLSMLLDEDGIRENNSQKTNSN